ncbi:helix-turn-helix domain-containing protein [Microbacterium amylolyticum]|uniref:Quercetin dioxygenase-like cupin family protein n=2 Tax=Microbacterium amylolyticum TaxID=936337 RepID=A0ABS4ZGR1_9MICO|nr:XRE family transcriptional regulator [Microbacterium amylolyticum]MBP2436460.1 quercetin dioxygenase-like cupin family protein [Microbacterium amylolyticum]
MAERAGLSHAFLSQIERGIHQPSLSSLQRIAVALETSPVELVAAAEPPVADPPPVELLRAGEGAVPDGFSVGTARLLAHAPGFRPLEVDVTRSPRGEMYRHAEGEFIYVVSGTLHVELDGEEHRLDPGDSAYVAGGIPHRWWMLDGPARLVVVKETPG